MPLYVNDIRNPLKNSGVSQRQRQLTALEPQSVLIDERTLQDFLVFALNLARQVSFHNQSGQEDWTVFWEKDVSVFIASIQNTNPLPIKQGFDQLATQPLNGPRLQEMIHQILKIARNIDDWYKGIHITSGLKNEVKRLIQANLGISLPPQNGEQKEKILPSLLYRLLALEKEAQNTLFSEEYPSIDQSLYLNFSPFWGLNGQQIDQVKSSKLLSSAPTELPEKPTAEELEKKYIEILLDNVTELFTLAYSIYLQIIRQVAPLYFQESLNRSDHKPHIALFIAFLKLYQQLQGNLNELTQKHLDFYYKDVLGLKLKPSEPDKVHLFFELAKNVKEHQLKKDVRFKAGKDSEKKEIFYALNGDAVLNETKVASLRTLFLDYQRDIKNIYTDPRQLNGIYAAPVANSADGLGGEFPKEVEKPSWPTLGSKRDTTEAIVGTEARIGFAIATRELYLAEGLRTITLTLTSDDSINTDHLGLEFYLSGEKGWIEPDTVTLTSLDNDLNGLMIQLELTADQPAVVGFDPKVLLEDMGTALPVLKIILSDTSDTFENLKDFQLSDIQLTVDVQGLTTFPAFNDQGAVDPSGAFLPFGPAPQKGASFFIGSLEAFQKKLTSVTLKLDFLDIPVFTDDENNANYSKSWETFYKGYEENNADPSIIPTGINYTASITKSTGDESLISDAASIPSNIEGDQKTLTELPFEYDQLANAIGEEEVDNYAQNKSYGFLRLILETDFLHTQYPQILSRQMLGASGFSTVEGVVKNSNNEVIIPNPPYTPTANSLTLDYTSTSNIGVDGADMIFMHIHPFAGTYQQFGNIDNELPLVSVKNKIEGIENEVEGILFIGLENLRPEQNLDLLFQVVDSTASTDIPEDENINTKIQWQYLRDNEWVNFPGGKITSDTTLDLTTSGIVSFSIPLDINKNNTILPNHLHWIRAYLPIYADAVSETINVHAQAALITFQDNDNTDDHLNTPLPEKTILKLEVGDSAIKKINQEYDSFGGRPIEQPLDFYTRISERLRHKGRAITLYDYERIILEAFPNIYKVKCINHTNSEGLLRPGYVLIAVVPDFTQLKIVNRREPKVTSSVLRKIKAYLDERNTTFVSDDINTLQVVNPNYEKVNVSFDVQFKADVTAIEFHIQKLKEAIIRFLSPWAYSLEADINFGGKIYKSTILNFVEEQEYVDFVTNFRMNGIYFDTQINEIRTETNVEVFEAKTPQSILVPDAIDQFLITEFDPKKACTTPENQIPEGTAPNKLLGTIGEVQLENGDDH